MNCQFSEMCKRPKIRPDFIRCEFDADLCHWTVEKAPETETFFWDRVNAEILEANETDGPHADHFDDPTGYFAFVSAHAIQRIRNIEPVQLREIEPGTTLMRSPVFSRQEHPVECLEFFYFLMVLLVFELLVGLFLLRYFPY